MKIGIQTWGSNGDVRPLLALATGLSNGGHEIALRVSSIDNRSYARECEALNISYRSIPDSIDFDLEDFARRSFRMHPLQWLTSLLDEAFFPFETEIYDTARQLCAENDIVIGHHFLYPLKLAARQAGKPFISVTFCPAAIPNPSEPPFGFPGLGPAINTISWKLLDAVFNWALKKRLSRLWLNNGHAVPHNILTEHLTSQDLNLVAVDPLFCAHNRSWPVHHQVCGFLNFTEDSDCWEIPDSLSRFLASGPPPVYMTFGSVQQAVPEWSMDLFIHAAALADCRAIIQTSSSRFPDGTLLNDRVYCVGRHPHQPIFERCAAIVHHGGAGTTHAATRAGCPSVAIPFMDEQLFWATKLQRLQLAGKPLPAKTVNAADLAKAIRTITANEHYRHNARRAARAMQTDSSIAYALHLLENFLKDR